MASDLARLAATDLTHVPRPLRLCYRGVVFRYEAARGGHPREVYQIGGECIGDARPEADAEVIAVAVEVLTSVRIRQFRVVLGEVSYVRGCLGGLPPARATQVLEAIGHRDAARIETLVSGTKAKQLRGLLELVGREEVFRQAQRLASNTMSRRALGRLRRIWHLLHVAGAGKALTIDLAEVRGFAYYTGPVCEIFVDGWGYPLVGGGRYDTLLARFGRGSPATGFALDLEMLQEVWERQRL